MTPPRVLFVSHEASLTGAPLVLLQVVRYLREQLGIAPYIAICNNNGDALLEQISQFGPVWKAWTSRPPDWPDRFELIYSNTITNGAFVESLGMRDVPVITHVHELTETILAFGRNNLSAVLRQTDMFIACSPSVRNHLVFNLGVADEDVAFIPAFISVARINRMLDETAPVAADTIASWGDDFVIGGAGWAGYRKGTDFLFGLIRHLPERIGGRRIRLAWVGGNSEAFAIRYPEELRARISALGQQKNPFPFFQRYDVFALTSREDPFPLVMLENAYLRRPILGFAGSGGLDDLAAAGAALALPMLNVERFASALLVCALDPAFSRRLGERAHRVVQEFVDDVCLPQIAALTRKLLDHPRARAQRDLPEDLFTTPLEGRLYPLTRGSARLYYGPGEPESIGISYDRTAPASLHVHVPTCGPSVSLRFDPDHVPGIFELVYLVIADAHGRELLRCDDTHSWDAIEVAGTARRLDSTTTLRLLSVGVDPQILIPLLDGFEGELTVSCELRTMCARTEFGLALQEFFTAPTAG